MKPKKISRNSKNNSNMLTMVVLIHDAMVSLKFSYILLRYQQKLVLRIDACF